MENTVEKYICLTIALINFTSYFWSVIGVFKKQKEMDFLNYRLLQVISLTTWVSLSFDLIYSNSTVEKYNIVSFVLFICLVIFWFHSRIVKKNSFSIAFSKDTPSVLVMHGLYKYIRHPFYFTYLLCYFSIACFFGSSFSISMSFIMLIIYYKAARFEESKFNESNLSFEYKKYIESTGMFLPWFG